MAVSNAVAKQKKYVGVTAYFSDRGGMRPMYILWEDGRKFSIDKVVTIKTMAVCCGTMPENHLDKTVGDVCLGVAVKGMSQTIRR